MTEWTPEEEAVARAMYERRHWGMKNVWSWDDSGLDDEHPGVRENILLDARAAIAAMQPRWRDVRTDPPPRDGTEFDVWNSHERVVDVFWSTKRQAWCRSEYETGHGYVDYTVMPFTHWLIVPPPLPTPEDRT